MVKSSQILKQLQIKLAELEATNHRLEARIHELEQPVPEPINEETMLVIAAAVAAYLGERAHIRVVRLVPSTAWAQQGRVSIQASHHLV